MKNAILCSALLLGISVTTGCAPYFSSELVDDRNELHPPAWIQGQWGADRGVRWWEFTSDDAVSRTLTWVGDWFKIDYADRDVTGIVSDSSTSTTYTLVNETWGDVYSFSQIDATKLTYSDGEVTETLEKG